MGHIRFCSQETEIIKWQTLGVEPILDFMLTNLNLNKILEEKRKEKMLTEAQTSQYHEDSKVERAYKL